MAARAEGGWLRYVRGLALSGVLGLSLAYAVFHSLYPMATFPVESDPSPLLLGLVLGIPSILVGFASTDIVPVIFESFLAVALGFVLSAVLVLSPVAMGLYTVAADTVPGFILHYTFVLFALALFVNLVGGLVGLAARNYLLARIPRPPSWVVQRK